jgi:hypothetical protein
MIKRCQKLWQGVVTFSQLLPSSRLQLGGYNHQQITSATPINLVGDNTNEGVKLSILKEE